jgi:hypothetical protein
LLFPAFLPASLSLIHTVHYRVFEPSLQFSSLSLSDGLSSPLSVGELSLASNRCNRISGQIGTGTPATQLHKSQLAASIQSITREIDSVERSKVLVSMRCGALQHYMELILKINGDLTKRIGESEGIQDQIR